MRYLSTAIFAGALLASLTAAPLAVASGRSPVAPNYRFPDGSKGFLFTSHGGLVNPEVIVGFNPQPDPPGFGDSRFLPGDGFNTSIFTPPSGTGYGFLIGLLNVGPDGHLPLPRAPNSDGNTGEIFTADGSVFKLLINFSGPGSVIDWAAFNPQPEPPGDFLAGQFAFSGEGDPIMTFSLTENERPLFLTLASAPEPSTWALMLVGFGGLGAALRRHRRNPGSQPRVIATPATTGQ